jgi:DNA-binding NarL/FixJ family response regulator
VAVTPTPIQILVAEDDALLRGLLNQILGEEPDFQVVGLVGDGASVIAEIDRLQPEVLLLDVNLPGASGLQVLKELRARSHSPKTLVLSGNEDDATQLEAARVGARGFLCKSEALGTLPEAVRKVARGEVWFSGRIIGMVLNDYPEYVRKSREQERPINQLSDREREVLIRVARGHTNQMIAGELYMSLSTVKVHLRNIFSKLKLPNRTEAAVFAVREGLLHEE